MATVELIYDPDCPNVEKARAELLRAFVKAGRPPRWMEWERSDPQGPSYVKGYGSPTVLVNGQDVAGGAVGVEGDCCRVYFMEKERPERAPSAEAIAAALLKAGDQRLPASTATIQRHNRWRSVLVSFPAIGGALAAEAGLSGLLAGVRRYAERSGIGLYQLYAILVPLDPIFSLHNCWLFVVASSKKQKILVPPAWHRSIGCGDVGQVRRGVRAGSVRRHRSARSRVIACQPAAWGG